MKIDQFIDTKIYFEFEIEVSQFIEVSNRAIATNSRAMNCIIAFFFSPNNDDMITKPKYFPCPPDSIGHLLTYTVCDITLTFV